MVLLPRIMAADPSKDMLTRWRRIVPVPSRVFLRKWDQFVLGLSEQHGATTVAGQAYGHGRSSSIQGRLVSG